MGERPAGHKSHCGDRARRGPTRRRFGASVLTLAAFLPAAPSFAERGRMNAYDFEFTSIEGDALPLSRYRGKPLLVVNTASFCGYTPQYRDLEAVWRRYRDRGLVVIGVPSNDFGEQEPGSAQEIRKFCETNYEIDFPLTEKQRVVGGEAHPFFRWIAEELGDAGAPRWNFHKYLVAPDGSLAAAWPSRVRPTDREVDAEIEKLLPR